MATKFAPQKKIFSLDVELSSGGNVAHQPVLPPCLAARSCRHEAFIRSTKIAHDYLSSVERGRR
jgi:hypothetical protein